MKTDEPHVGILTIADLRRKGMRKTTIARAVHDGSLARIRRGWYSEPQASQPAIAAVRVGGVLTAGSASPHHGLWTPESDKIHVLVARNASRLRMPDPGDDSQPTVCLHWAPGKLATKVVADPLQLIVDALHCCGLETAVVLADSALNVGVLRLAQLQAVVPEVARWCDPKSQSGTETFTRLRLCRKGISVRSQVSIGGVGRVDLVVGERLVIECDSKAFHEGYRSTRDYDRDMELIRQGYLVLRLKYRHVMFEWPSVESLILEIVRARRHL